MGALCNLVLEAVCVAMIYLVGIRLEIVTRWQRYFSIGCCAGLKFSGHASPLLGHAFVEGAARDYVEAGTRPRLRCRDSFGVMLLWERVVCLAGYEQRCVMWLTLAAFAL